MLAIKSALFNTIASLLRFFLHRGACQPISGLPHLHQKHIRFVLLNGTHLQRLTLVSHYKLDPFNLNRSLTDEPFWFARCKALENNEVPDHLWKTLILDPNLSFRLDLIEKDNCPHAILLELSRKDPADIIRTRAHKKLIQSSSLMRALKE